MPSLRHLFALAGALLAVTGARAAEPVTVELNPRVTVGTALVTVGDVALVSGGDANVRARVARIDLAEFKARDATAAFGRRAVEYRLQLAGFDAAAVRVVGAERVTVTPARRPVTVEEVTAAARAELMRHYGGAPGVVIELAQPVAVKLPEVPADERAAVTAKAHGQSPASGRVQMDMTVAAGGETLLAFAVHLDVKPAGVVAAGGTAPAATAVLVRARQRVEVSLQRGELKAVMTGEAQQDGRLGQTVYVQNPDSKKLVPAKVTGPGTLEIELGGTP